MTSLKPIVVSFVFSFYLIACNNNENKKYDKVINEINIGKINYKIYNKSFGTNVSKDGSQLDTTEGYFLKIDLGITNNSSEVIKFDTAMFKLSSNTGKTFSFSNIMNETMRYFDTSLNEIEIIPNTTKNGFIIFNVPAISDYNLELNNGSRTKDKNTVVIKPVD